MGNNYMSQSPTLEGEWKEDQMSGVGTFHYASGAVYQVYVRLLCLISKGEWLDNKYNGKGKYTFPDGSFYQGDWLDNK